MSLSDLASLGSFVSGIAVIATLIFLALQMRQTNRNQRSLIQQGRAVHLNEIHLLRANPHMSAAFAHLNEDYRTLSPSELLAIRAYLIALSYAYQDSFQQYRAGTLSAASWDVDATTFRGLAGNAAFRTEWVSRRDSYATPEWRDYVDALIRETPVRKPRAAHAVWLAEYEKQLPA
jgi:hypothetical protein